MLADECFKIFILLITISSVFGPVTCYAQYDANSVDNFDPMAHHNRCEPITIPFCQNLEYNTTIMPNSLNHTSQKEAADVIHNYTPAIKYKCSPDTHFFLCTLYFPICTILDTPIPPCKSLCLSVKNGCEKILQSFSFDWPEHLNCDKFPEQGVCVSKNQTITSAAPDHGRIDNGYSIQGTTPRSVPRKNNETFPITGNHKDFAFTCPDHFKVAKGYDDSFKVGNVVAKNCGIPCDGMFFTPEEIKFSRIWIGIWSCVCAASCLFTVSTFLINTSRFRYPERPVIFLSVCYLIVSIIYIVGFLLGDEVACRRPFPPPVGKPKLATVSTVSQGTKGEICTIMFIGLYYFSMASSLWWVILALTWFLAAGLKWGHEAIEANSQYFHLMAWAIPAVKTITILGIGKIEGDVLTGVCFVGLWNTDMLKGFVLTPLTIYLILGTLFLVSGFVSLFRIRTAMKHDGTKTDKLEKLMLRIGVFSVLYMVPAITVIVCLFYEQANFDHWMVSWHWQICQKSQNYLIRCPSNVGDGRKPSFYMFMLKYLSSLIVGISSSVWMWSGKTVSSWKELFHRIQGKTLHAYV
ncbi:frizzled-2-like [Planococcus citri]|uniref:frizzled-2-like n=1 Tax=Planococcus citri TaxID=170843 RepID=UPI0031F75605